MGDPRPIEHGRAIRVVADATSPVKAGTKAPAKAPNKPVGQGGLAPRSSPADISNACQGSSSQNVSEHQACIPQLVFNGNGTIYGGLEGLVRRLLAHNDGLFFGSYYFIDDYKVVARFLTLLSKLKESRVKDLYVDMVDSANQADLDQFQKDGDTEVLKEKLLKAGWTRSKVTLNHFVYMLAEARIKKWPCMPLVNRMAGL